MAAVPSQSFPMQRKRTRGILVCGIGVVAAGAELLRRGTWPAGAWVTIACGAAIVLWFGQPAWRRAPRIWFDERGLSARVPGFGPLPWVDIEHLRFVRVNGKAFLVIDRVRGERRRSPPGALARAIARGAAAADLAVPLDGLAAAPDQVFAVVDLAHRHAVGGFGPATGSIPDREPRPGAAGPG